MTFPILDVSELLSDPLFVQTQMTVLRRRQVLTKGRDTPEVYQTITGVVASIQPKDTAIGGNFIERKPDMEFRGSNLNVYTKFRLRGVTQQATGAGSDGDYLPDIIVVNGDHFLVALTNDWSHYGAGYIHAEVESVEAIDYAPDGAPP